MLLNTTFICPYMKITLEGTCSLSTCPYYTKVVKSNCIWEYVSSKNSISAVELAIILGKEKKEILDIFKKAKLKLIEVIARQKLNARISNIKYCKHCGRAFNLKKENEGYVCIEVCEDLKICTDIEKRYDRPISYVLLVLSATMNLSILSKLFETSNKNIKQMYMAIFGDCSLLTRDRERGFKKRAKKLIIKNIYGKRSKTLSFSTINKQIDNFK